MYLDLLKEMFNEMVLKKNASLIPFYYDENFLLYANGEVIDYDNYLKSHYKYYAEEREYNVEYDDVTFVEANDKLAGRMWITLTFPNKAPRKIEVILIVQYKNKKIFRLWELTFPDWTRMPEFEK